MSIKDLKEGSGADLSKLNEELHKTTPPARFSESSLVERLEKLGIGRPSTFSSIVTINQTRGYVQKKGQQLYPTWLGFKIAQYLEKYTPSFVSYESTAKLDEELDKIEEGSLSKLKFLKGEWASIVNKVKPLGSNINWEDVNEISLINLNDDYQVRVNKFGSFLERKSDPLDDKGNRRGVMLTDDDNVSAIDFSSIEECGKIFEAGSKTVESNELGPLESGEYKGWIVTVRDGRYGKFAQAVKAGADPKKVKPVNQTLPEDTDISMITMEEVAPLFAEIKLPRWSDDGLWLVGIGKRGPYMGRKASKKGRPVFRSLPEGVEVRTVPFTEVKKLWDEAEVEAKAKKAAPKKTATKKTTAKKTTAKKTPGKE